MCGFVRLHPHVILDLLNGRSVLRREHQTLLDEVFHLRRNVEVEVDLHFHDVAFEVWFVLG